MILSFFAEKVVFKAKNTHFWKLRSPRLLPPFFRNNSSKKIPKNRSSKKSPYKRLSSNKSLKKLFLRPKKTIDIDQFRIKKPKYPLILIALKKSVSLTGIHNYMNLKISFNASFNVAGFNDGRYANFVNESYWSCQLSQILGTFLITAPWYNFLGRKRWNQIPNFFHLRTEH